MADVIEMPEREPSTAEKLRLLAAKSETIVMTRHGGKRGNVRKISALAIQRCLQRGVIVEEFQNVHGHIQVTVERRAAGEEMTCVGAIDWPNKIVVITVY